MMQFANEYDGILFARYIARAVQDYFKDDEHKREFEEYYLEKYGREYHWKKVYEDD